MLIFGVRSTQVGAETLTNTDCPNCGSHGTIVVSVFQKYFHIFWIPFFPTGKKAASICSNCKQVLMQDQMRGQMELNTESIRSEAKTPVWLFSGLMLAAVLTAWNIYRTNQRAADNAVNILSPKQNDIYHLKLEAKDYRLWKVTSVVGDTVFVLPSNYSAHSSLGLDEMKKKGDAFGNDTQRVRKAELKGMFDSGVIVDIDR